MKNQNNLLQIPVDVGRSLAQSSGAVGQGNNQKYSFLITG